METGGNYTLAGDPEALGPADLRSRIEGLVDATEAFVPLLRTTFPDLGVWHRVIFDLSERPRFERPGGHEVRRLGPEDTHHLWGLSRECAWICDTWGGPPGLAASRHAWGAFANGRLASVACSFFVGESYEDVGIVTEPEFRGLGLAVACAGALCEDIQGRGRLASWSTAPDNTASARVAEKLGFSVRRQGVLYVVGMPIPESPRVLDLIDVAGE